MSYRYFEICDHEDCRGCYTEYQDYEIINIHGHYWSYVEDCIMYYVEWLDYPLGDDAVVSERNMVHATRLIRQYWRQYRVYLLHLLYHIKFFQGMPIELGFMIVDMVLDDVKTTPKFMSPDMCAAYWRYGMELHNHK